jgi:hypothetical protein
MKKLSEWFEMMKEGELSNVEEGNVNKVEEFEKLCNEFWKFEGEDRDIILEDLKKDEGILYKKMVEWNENELLIEEDLNMVWWEYSLEEYFRDMFNKESKFSDFKLFSLDEINEMMYGEGWDNEDN